MPGQDENQAAPAPEKRTELLPGKIRVEQMTLDRFNGDQQSALRQANMERTARGLPGWEVADYVRVHAAKFPDVDIELDQIEHADRAAKASVPPDAARVDQRPVR